MECEESDIPVKKARVDINYDKCIICQDVKGGTFVKNPVQSSYGKLLEYIAKRAEYGETHHLHLKAQLNDVTASQLHERRAVYHRECYSDTCHKRSLEAAKKRFEKSIQIGRSPSLSQIPGRPSATAKQCQTVNESSSVPFTRSSTAPFTRNMCFFCQQDDPMSRLHKVSTFNAGEKLQKAVKDYGSDSLQVRLSTAVDPTDAHAIDVKYHLKCWVSNVEHPLSRGHTSPISPSAQTSMPSETKCHKAALAEIEFITMVNGLLQDDAVLDMASVQNAFTSIRRANGMEDAELDRRTIKSKLKEHFHDIQFGKSSNSNESERVFLKSTGDAAVSSLNTTSTSDEETVFKSAQILRKVLEKKSSDGWNFQGTFEKTDDHVPPELYSFLRWLLIGPASQLNNKNRDDKIHREVVTVSDVILQAYKSDKQVAYKPQNTQVVTTFRSSREWPLQLGVGLAVHQSTRSRDLIDLLHSYGLSVDYQRILRIETQLAHAVTSQMTSEGIYIPQSLQKGRFIFFAIDNSDFNEDTPDGKNTTHATATAVFQQKFDDDVCSTCVPVKTSSRSFQSPVEPQLLNCYMSKTVKPESPTYKQFAVGQNNTVLVQNRVDDMVWLLSKTKSITLREDSRFAARPQFPSWAAYNSLISTGQPLTRVCVLPLLMAPASDWSTLLTVLKQAQGINTAVVGPDRKTVITLDMQLYEKAKQLEMSRQDCKGKWVLRIGELHTTMAALRAAGNLIEGSGLDDAWVEADLYGPATVRQILECRHYKRAINAHTITLQALFLLFQDAFFRSHTELSKKFDDLVHSTNQALVDGIEVTTAHEKMAREMKGRLTEEFGEFTKARKPMFKVFCDYMELILTILSFIKATRQGNWNLHLASLESLTKYFFALDKLHYARMVPLYIAEMRALEETDSDVWNEFRSGNFVVNKNKVSFCSIGPDHGIEHENRWMKVSGGLIGITLNESARTRLFLIAPELARLAEEVLTIASSSQCTVKQKHHELSEHLDQQQDVQVEKLKETLVAYHDPFTYEEDGLVSIISHTFMPENVVHDMCKLTSMGENAYSSFVNERITTGCVNLWAPMKKMNLHTWQHASKSVTHKSGSQVVELKTERNLFARCLIVARSRPDIDIRDALGTYEFSTYPRSLFDSSGQLLPTVDKSKLMSALEACSPVTTTVTATNDAASSQTGLDNENCTVIDGMAVVQEMGKPQWVKTCSDLADHFCTRIQQKGSRYKEVHVVFDRYDLPKSLKEATRKKRAGSQKSIIYQVADNTPLANVSMKKFLSHKSTKDQLTSYLSERVVQKYAKSQQTVIVSHKDCVLSNKHTISTTNLESSHEEADTKIILHAKEAALRGIKVLDIQSPDTDVMVLSIRRYPDLPVETNFITGTGNARRSISIKTLYATLGEITAAALPGFHAFTGADQTGRFAGKSKFTCWKIFQSVSNDIKTAFVSLGKSELPSSDTEAKIEQFVCALYDRDTCLTSVAEVRWKLFCKTQAEAEKLPPTNGALHQKILRAHYQSMIWSADIVPKPDLPPPSNYGWTERDGLYEPVPTLIPPAPDSVVELVRCQCSKSKCETTRCTCKQHKLHCTEMCKCQSNDTLCRNNIEDYVTSLDNLDDDD